MVDILVIGGHQGLPPGMQDLLERLREEISEEPKPDIEDCPIAKDLENAHKQNLELLKKADEAYSKTNFLKERIDYLNRERMKFKDFADSLSSQLDESESRYQSALEAGKAKDAEIARLNGIVKMLESAFKASMDTSVQVGCENRKLKQELLKSRELTEKQTVYEKEMKHSNMMLISEIGTLEGKIEILKRKTTDVTDPLFNSLVELGIVKKEEV